MTTTTRTTELATIVTGLRACKTRQAIGLIYEGMAGYNLADDDTEASLEDLRGTALDYVREICADEGIHCADVGLTGNYVIQQETGQHWEPIEKCATLEEAKAAIASMNSELGWKGMRVVLDDGPRYNLSGKLLTGDDAHEVVFVQDEPAGRDISEWTVIDRRTNKTVAPAVLFADAQWIDRDAADYRADTLDGERSINDSDIHIYEIPMDGCVAYVARGTGLREIVLSDEPIKWRDLLAGWDTGDSTFEELLASFGLDATSALDEADADFDGPCKIWIESNFYAGTLGDTRDRYWSDPETGDCTPTVFKSFADAQAWIEETEGSRYYLSHGEAGRPSYTICKA